MLEFYRLQQGYTPLIRSLLESSMDLFNGRSSIGDLLTDDVTKCLRIITSNKKYSSVLLQIKVLINTFFVSGYFENHSLWAYNVQKMCERYNQKCRNGA